MTQDTAVPQRYESTVEQQEELREEIEKVINEAMDVIDSKLPALWLKGLRVWDRGEVNAVKAMVFSAQHVLSFALRTLAGANVQPQSHEEYVKAVEDLEREEAERVDPKEALDEFMKMIETLKGQCDCPECTAERAKQAEESKQPEVN